MTMSLRNRLVPVLAGLALLGAGAVRADEPAVKGPTFAGYVQGSFNYDLNDPASGATFMRVYDAHHNTFSLNNAHVAMTGSIGDVAYTVETDMGHDAAIHRSSGFGVELFDGTGANVVDGSGANVDPDVDTFDLQEAYVTFPDPILSKMGLKATMKVGKFVTYEGIEVIESGANPTVTRGSLFGFAEPYTHTGGALTLTFGAIAVSAGLLNGWDRLVDDNDAKMGVLNVNIGLGEKVGMVNLTGYSGAEGSNTGKKKNSLDLTGVLKVLPKTDLWYQVNYGDEEQVAGGVNKWGGAGIQPLFKFSDAFSLGLRLEYFELKAVGAAYGAGSLAVSNATAALGWNFAKGVTTRLEFRHDESGSALPFEDSFGNFRHRANTVTLETIVSF